tara:strand:- start:1394 stop:1645 length:252 start_codon:yes stop_codon:yes gene_type:complete
MSKRRTLTYILDDGQKITSRQLSEELGCTESASRNRLNRHTDPVLIFAPFNKSKGGRPKGKQKKEKVLLPYKDPMWKLALKNI